MKYGNAAKMGALALAGILLGSAGVRYAQKKGVSVSSSARDFVLAVGCVAAGEVGRVMKVPGSRAAGYGAAAVIGGMHLAKRTGQAVIDTTVAGPALPDMTYAPQTGIEIGGAVPTYNPAAPALPAPQFNPQPAASTVIYQAPKESKPTTVEYFGGKLIDGAATILGKLVGSGAGRDPRFAAVGK